MRFFAPLAMLLGPAALGSAAPGQAPARPGQSGSGNGLDDLEMGKVAPAGIQSLPLYYELYGYKKDHCNWGEAEFIRRGGSDVASTYVPEGFLYLQLRTWNENGQRVKNRLLEAHFATGRVSAVKSWDCLPVAALAKYAIRSMCAGSCSST